MVQRGVNLDHWRYGRHRRSKRYITAELATLMDPLFVEHLGAHEEACEAR